MRLIRGHIGFWIALAACASAPMAADDARRASVERFAGTVRPTRYTAELAVDPAKDEMSGEIAIDLELSEPTDVISLHGKKLDLDEAELVLGTEKLAARAVRRQQGALVDFKLAHPVGPGAATLRVRYRAHVATEGELGAFRRTVGDRRYIFTSFEALSARDVFPCFDDPAFKAPWRLTLRVPHGLVAAANSPIEGTSRDGNVDVVRFAESPPLPSYLIAFAVGPFDVVEAGRTAGGVPMRILVPAGRSADARYAATAIGPILGELERYFGSGYPFAKLDAVDVPGVSRSMENPGLVTFSESVLLARPSGDDEARRRVASELIAHELAHMWFGDLVTPRWWDDIWLNESFATWMSARAIAGWQRAWPAEVRAVAWQVTAWRPDSLPGGRAIRQVIVSEADINASFDAAVTYEKGGAVLAMIEGWLGPDVYRGGIQRYLAAHANGTVNAADLLTALEGDSGKDVRGVAATFVTQSGVPRVRAALRCEPGRAPVVSLAQERYTLAGVPGDARRWRIPVCVRAAGTEAETCTVLDDAHGEVALEGSCPAWIYPNAGGRGYYVSSLGGGLRAALLAHASELTRAERFHFLADLVADVEAGELPIGDVMASLPQIGPAAELELTQRALAAARDVAILIPDGKKAAYARFLRLLFGARLTALGQAARPDDTADEVILRAMLLEWLASEGEDTAVARTALVRAEAWLVRPSELAAPLLPATLVAAAATGDRGYFEHLQEALRKVPDRETRVYLLRAVAGFRTPDLIEAAFQLALDSRFPEDDARVLLAMLAAGPATRRAYLDLVRWNVAALNDRFRGVWPIPVWCDPSGLEDYVAFIDQLRRAPALREQVVDSARSCVAFRAFHEPSAVDFLSRP